MKSLLTLHGLACGLRNASHRVPMPLVQNAPTPPVATSGLARTFGALSVTHWTLIAFLLLYAREMTTGMTRLIDGFGDTDDAMRLVEIRDLLAGQGWFDMVPHRLSPPDQIASHWSRLLDLPLAGLTWLFARVLPMAQAEALMRLVWPPLLLLPLMLLTARFTESRAGRNAALFALGLSVASLSARFQFVAGRIDHHNVLILCACGGLFLAVRALDDHAFAIPAGLLSGLGLAIGFEGLPLTLITAAGMALAALVNRAHLPAVACFWKAMALVLVTAFLATTPPQAMMKVTCDALSLNLVALVGCSALGFWAAEKMPLPNSPLSRLSFLAPFGLMGMAAYGLMEPACLAGPFGQVDPAIRPIWLDHVAETRSLFALIPVAPFAALAFAVTAFVAAPVALRQAYRQRNAGETLYAIALAISVLLAVWQVKIMPYASWLALPALGRLCATLPAVAGVRASTVRIACAALLCQTSLVALSSLIPASALPAGWASSDPATVQRDQKREAECLSRQALAPLGALPPGLIAAPIDMGSALIAFTPHSVLAAPYHRHSAGMIIAHAVLTSPPDQARTALASRPVRYIVTCAHMHDEALANPRSLNSALLRGETPPYLTPVLQGSDAVKVWRVLP